MCEITPDQSARLRHATVITIPNGASTTSLQEHVSDFFRSSAPTDLAIPGQSLCPYCADSVHENSCDWTLLPWTSDNAPDRVFFRSSCIFRGLHGQPMATSATFTVGASYSLVGVSYFVALGGGSRRNHFVSQVRLRGRWHNYDCVNGGVVTSSDTFDGVWHASSVHMLVYVRSSSCVATPAAYDPSSSATPSRNIGTSASRVLRKEPMSPSGHCG